MEPSLALRLFGTEEPVPECPTLRAGPLEASLDAGNLRHIKIGGVEAIRAVSFIVRDRNWGTYGPEITGLAIDQRGDGFTVTYDAVCRDAAQALRYRARIEGRADGSLVFAADGEALGDFVTNRTGFVVLHGVEGIAGAAVEVEHVDGTVERSRFPELIDPVQPFKDIRALTHEVSPGVRVCCRMEGDSFEMEDQRNWTDASYKTYVRPLALPWPYTLAAGERVAQRVSLELSGAPPSARGSAGAGPVTVTLGAPTGSVMPPIGLAVPAEHAESALAAAALVKAAAPAFLVCHLDPRRGHGRRELELYRELGAATGAGLVLEAVLPCLDAAGRPTGDEAVLARDLAAIRAAADAAGVAFARVVVSPAADLKCTLPGSVWPATPSWEALARHARAAFPGAAIGGGMLSYFTELNRKRPPAQLLDFIGHTTCPLVHAGDDLSLTEGLESLPYIFKSVRAFAGGSPYWLLPTAISMRDNPYGAAPMENPGNVRVAMARVDPRERSLAGAAWYAGYIAHAARAGLDALTLAAATGPSGIAHARLPWPQPWLDDAGARVHPSWHVLREHARRRGAALHASASSRPRDVQATALVDGDGLQVCLSNLTGTAQRVRLDGLGPAGATLRALDETTFVAACCEPEAFARQRAALTGDELELRPYATAWVERA